MKNLAIKLTRKDTVGNIGTIWGVGALDPFSCLLSFGKGITDENFKKCLLSDREAYLAMQFMHDMIFRLKIQPKKGDMNDQKAHQIFANNKIAMTVGHTWDMQQLLEIKNITWDIANHPKEKLSRNWISTEGLSVYKNSRKKEDAVKYILFVTGEEMQKKFINENCPSIINLLSDNELHKKTIYNWKILPSYIENGVTEPKTAKVFEIKSKFTMMIEEIMTKENSPKQIQFILEKYTKIINEVLNSD
ncbi:MAG TPA: hypothetical protein DC049_18540 [Spirochaetia bacterium]|nr:hypothetical protein [Spirochaetia bacterium]